MCNVVYYFVAGDRRSLNVNVSMLFTSLNSVVQNHAKADDIVFHILHHGLTDEEKTFLYQLSRGHTIEIIDIPWAFDPSYKVVQLNKLAALGKISANKAVYLDLDTVCTMDIQELYDISLDSHSCAGSLDLMLIYYKRRNPSYINSGVLLYNPNFFRDFDRHTYLQKLNNYRFADQDILNELTKPKILPFNFNVELNPFHHGMTPEGYKALTGYSAHNTEDLTHIPGILHFLGELRPFNKATPESLSRIWYSYWPRPPRMFELKNTDVNLALHQTCNDYYVRIRDTYRNRSTEYLHPDHIRCASSGSQYCIDCHGKPLPDNDFLARLKAKLSTNPIDLYQIAREFPL